MGDLNNRQNFNTGYLLNVLYKINQECNSHEYCADCIFYINRPAYFECALAEVTDDPDHTPSEWFD